mgnify:CR=1 FL=1
MTTLPTIHQNGTGARTLMGEYSAVAFAAKAAFYALSSSTCDQRDFYPQGEAAWKAAQAERQKALRMLNAVILYAEDWQLHATENEFRAMDAKRGKEGD